MTHHQLVKLAKKWLVHKGCVVVLTEKASRIGEIPDSIGWEPNGRSTLIECKASRADFRRDKNKWFRINSTGLGQRKYFMAPEGLIPRDEVPESWGLLEVSGTVIRTVINNDLLYYDKHRAAAELPLLVACLKKAQIELSEQSRSRRKRVRNHGKSCG